MENNKKWKIVEIKQDYNIFYTLQDPETGRICKHKFVLSPDKTNDGYFIAKPDLDSAVLFDPEKDEVKGEGLFSDIWDYDGLVATCKLKNGEDGYYYPDDDRLHDRTFEDAFSPDFNLALVKINGKYHYYNLEDGYVFEGGVDNFVNASIENLLTNYPEEYNHLPSDFFRASSITGKLSIYRLYIKEGLYKLELAAHGDPAFQEYKKAVWDMVEAKNEKEMKLWEEDKAAEEAEEAEMDE